MASVVGELNSFDEESFTPTVIVMGPRGSGKTTLVQTVLKGTKKVVTVSLNTAVPFTEEIFAQSILTALSIPYTPTRLSVQGLLEITLARHQKLPPILVVEADWRCSASHLEHLLLLLKHWGADTKLLRPLVVLSSLRAALGLTLNTEELHAQYFVLQDLTEAEGEQLLAGLCKPYVKSCTAEELSRFCKEVLPVLGMHPLHLDLFRLQLKIKLKGKQLSVQELHQEVDTFIAGLTTQYVRVLKRFLETVAGKDQRKQEAIIKLFTALKKGPLPLSRVITTLDMSETDFTNLVASLHPHPYFIDVRTLHVCLNAVVETAIDEEALKSKAGRCRCKAVSYFTVPFFLTMSVYKSFFMLQGTLKSYELKQTCPRRFNWLSFCRNRVEPCPN